MNPYESLQISLLKNLGKEITRLRRDRRLTLAGLAEKIGLAESELELVEEGKRILDLDLFTKISDALGVTLEQLFLAADDTRPKR